MFRIALTDAAYDAIASTLPSGAARWPMQRDRGQCFIQVEAPVVDRMRAMRRPGESFSEAHLAELCDYSGCAVSGERPRGATPHPPPSFR